MQRERKFSDYEDLEAHYENRPSLWVEPIGDWGEGVVELVEIPSNSEVNDNMVVFWRPHEPLKAKGEYIVTQMHLMQEGLRRSGLRDHAEEYSEFGVMPGCSLLRNLVALTPTIVPGAATICTSELVELVARNEPILLDVALDSWGRSIEGAIGLQGTGHGAHFSDTSRSASIAR